MAEKTSPESILIVGAGVFGLSTALALIRREKYAAAKVTVIDSSPTLPNPSGSSVDASRIVRPDYSNAVYSRLAAQAQVLWRDKSPDGWGGEDRYFEPGFLLTVDATEGQIAYLKNSLDNVKRLAEEAAEELGGAAKPIEVLQGQGQIRKASGIEGMTGNWGYVNWNSGWADAEKCVAFALRKVRAEGGDRVTVRARCKTKMLIVDQEGRCGGVQLENGELINADLTILATGAWTPTLIDLQGKCLATGQVLAYLAITDEEQKQLGSNPTVMNLSRGMFIIPPQKNELKVARHGFGYRSLETMSSGKISVPKVDIEVPAEGQQACREALAEMLPHLADRAFSRTRVCWYCDTPDGDFLIDYHPEIKDLFVATGGSGHGFKFFPVLGDRIVDTIEGKVEPELKQIWRWKDERVADFAGCDDGSRAGRRGMILEEEMARL